MAALNDSHIYVKESAVRALGDLGDVSALPKLECIAKSDNTLLELYGLTMRDVALEAIKKIHKRNKS
jgi:HEAT repeat protein